MNALGNLLKRLWRDGGGVTAVEYGLIAVAIIAVVTTLGSDLTNIFNDVSDGLKNGA